MIRPIIQKLGTVKTAVDAKLVKGVRKKSNKTPKMASGDHAEDLALKFLKQKKFKLEQRNFNCRYGEIDLIMWDQEYLVFIEVRYRASLNYGGALASINYAKQTKLRRAAEFYLLSTKRSDCACRFDILCINGNFNNPEYEWITNAF